EKTFAITIGAFLQIVQRIAPRMPPTGRIVTISGMDTHRYVAGHGILASAKAALEALTRYLAVELGPRGITVNCVNPGYVETDSVAMYLADEAGRKAFLEEIEGATPLPTLDELVMGLRKIGEEINMETTLRLAGGPAERKRVAVLVTKEPHCLAQLVQDRDAGVLNGDLVVVLSNHADLEPLAREHKIPFA